MYSDTQLVRIRRLAFDEYEDLEERSRLVSQVETSAELHQVAWWFNHDGFEVRELVDMAAHRHCSKGTALMIYWGLQPDWIYRQQEKGKRLDAIHLACLPFLKKLEQRVKENDFRGDAIAFSPEAMHGRQFRDDDHYRPGVRLVPAWMKLDVTGAVVERCRFEDEIT
ncbi:DUF4274 domain-containing protein [Actomonas aquatica]|uniref:DUF4274 domain-containing protein n=1 Tax=Actomonas aquatica TaxID=2866162 RepID=A0ABZ1CBP2_9BACT|nr:DUF4274 domain-containing protein [Opitutus sp. WL0086]WRQ88841.1 DUF4274 domain-containing protein [Opitutus sp. WL0086]WRQ88847.1 DUF4274 domain-containing protein [Opitutus sp. WL0086]